MAKKIQSFAREITSPQLLEYVATLSFPTHWVPNFGPEILTLIAQSYANVDEFVFVQMGPSMQVATQLLASGKKIWILNMEQMTRAEHKQPTADAVPFDFENWIFGFLRFPNVGVMDYSWDNIQIWKKLLPKVAPKTSPQIKWLPFLPALPELLRQPPLPEADSVLKPVVFVGDASSAHRSSILFKLEDVVHTLTGVFGEDRDVQLQQFPILLNVHFGQSYGVLEEIRVLPAVLRKQIVVSETSLFDKQHPLAKFIIFAPYERLDACVRNAIRHKEKLYAKLYDNNPHWDSLLDDIKQFAQRQK